MTIKYLDIDENFYIENNIVKVKINESDEHQNSECPIDEIWSNVKRIIMKAKEYNESKPLINLTLNEVLALHLCGLY